MNLNRYRAERDLARIHRRIAEIKADMARHRGSTVTLGDVFGRPRLRAVEDEDS